MNTYVVTNAPKIRPGIICHSSATEYLRCGGQLRILSKILSHSDICTMAIYIHLLTMNIVKSYDQFSPANSLNV